MTMARILKSRMTRKCDVATGSGLAPNVGANHG